jgi:hypothetical protein
MIKLLKPASFFLALVTGSLPNVLFSQNVGIGKANPTRAKLEVNGVAGAGSTSGIFGGESSGISLQRNWPTIGFNQYRDKTTGNGKYMADGFAAIQYLDPTTGSMYIDMFQYGAANTLTSAPTRALSINNNGNVAIKTEASNASLYAVKGTNFDGAAVFGGTSYNSFFAYGANEHTYIRGGKPLSNVYLNDIPSGRIILGGGSTMVGINAGDPMSTLEIRQINNLGLVLIDPIFNFNNWEYRVNYFASNGTSHLRYYYNGGAIGAYAPNGGYFGTSSDARIKTNITTLPPVLDKLNLLQPSVYEMKDHNDQHEKTFGFIAQEVKQLFPEIVSVKQVIMDSVNRVPDLHGLNHNGFSVIAVKALQEQYDQIKQLQKENDALMMRLEMLDKKIAAKKL